MPKLRLATGLASLVGVLLTGSTSLSADNPALVTGKTHCYEQCYLEIDLIGKIDQSTVTAVQRLIDEAHKQAGGKELRGSRIHLNSSGGGVASALAIGRLVRKERMIGAVYYGDACVSACVLVLAGAVVRIFEEVGIHRPYLEALPQGVSSEKFKDMYSKILEEVRAYLREMNTSDQLAGAMFRIEPDRIRLLSASAAEGYGLAKYDPVDKELSDLEQTKRWGLDRSEYMRRSRLADSVCDQFHGRWLECFNSIMKTGEWRAGTPAQHQSPTNQPSTSSQPCYSCFGEPVEPQPLPPPRQNPLGGLY
jgi:hypothetical protein